MKNFYITTPIYYVNSRPHIGHAYTTLSADVISRWRNISGDDVFFLTGTDEHGAKIAEAAKKSNKDPKDFTDEVSLEFVETWKNLGIEYSDFIRTTESRHEKGVESFMELLKNTGALYEGEYSGLYCTGCEKFMTEKDLVDNKCPDHNREPEKVVENNWFFKLSDYLKKIEILIKEDKIKICPDFAKKETLGLLKQNLEDFSVSRENVSWGIKLPWDQNQTVYVWVDALLNYITARGFPSISKDSWPADLQIIGKDILKFHAIYWPAMLLAAGLQTPREIFVHGYFTIDGKKMSKTIGNVIDPNDLVKEYGRDGARYLLLSQFPFGQDGDVKAEKFIDQYNSDLANGLGNLVSRVTSIVSSNNDLIFLDDLSESFCKDIRQSWERYESFFGSYAIEEAIKEIRALIKKSDEEVESFQIWDLVKKDKKRSSFVIHALLERIRVIAWMISPFMPETSEKIFLSLGIKNKSDITIKEAKELTWLPKSNEIKKCELLFPRK